MKSTHKVEKFDYSKFEKDPYWGSDVLKDYHFWGVHPKDNRFHIDTKRYKKMCKWIRIEEFMPEGMFLNRNSVYFVPAKIHRNDYKVNIFRDLLSELKEDWFNEYKPIFDLIKTPKQVEDETRTSEWMSTSCSDDCDEIDANATMAAIRRDSKYQEVIRSLYCQFITKVAVEVDRYTLIVMTECGFKTNDFDYKSFKAFTDGLSKDKNSKKIKDLAKYNAYTMLHKINNFLKHNSLSAYSSLKKTYPNNVRSKENGTSEIDYENGMFAGDWLIIKDGYIDKLLDQLVVFFEDYCHTFLNEDLEDSKWNYDDYFRSAIKTMSHPDEYFG